MRKRLSSAALVTVLALVFAATVSAAFWGIALGRLDWARTWGGAYYLPPEEPGSVSGVVTDADGNPIEGAWVAAGLYDDSWWGQAWTDADGSYRIDGLAPGEYRAEVWAEGYLHEYYDGVRQLEDATPVAVKNGDDTPNIDFNLDPGGSISGIVTDAQGNPVEGAWVGAGLNDGSWWGQATSGADGTYKITGLVTGEYRVDVWAEGYFQEFYDGVRDWEIAAPVSVVEGQGTPNINFSLDEGGTISGIVTDAQGNPIEGAWVGAFSDDSSGWGSTETDADGSYEIDGLTTGEYRVRVSAEGYVDEIYDGVRDWETATPVFVIEGQATPNINFSLDLGGTISGIVTDAQGNPIAGAWVDAHSDDSGDWGHAETGPDGSYSIRGLVNGEYRVWADAYGYLDELYDGVRDWEDATLVPVVEGQDTPNINFRLDVGGTISGVVTDVQGNPIEGAWIYADSDSGWGHAETGSDGAYQIAGLPTGEYRVDVWADGYLYEYYDGVRDWEIAAPVSVVEGQDTPNINFSLDLGGTISGIVTDAQGNPIAGAWVEAESVDGGGWGYAETDADGSYEIIGLASGEYRVDVWANGYLGEYYDGARKSGDATLVGVTEGQETLGIDFSLDVGGTISGVVTNAKGNPIEGAQVEAYSDDGNVWGYTETNPDGFYKLIGLASGEYRVGVWADGYPHEYYDGVFQWENATLVAVAENQDTPDINFALPEPSTPNPGPLRLDIDADAENGFRPCDPVDSVTVVEIGEDYRAAICVSGLPQPLAAFQLDVKYDDTLSVVPEIACPAGDCLDDNPDANAGSTTWGGGLGSGWDCNVLDLAEPRGDRDWQTGPGHGDAQLACWTLQGPYTFGDDESSGVLGLVQFIAIGTGSNGLTLSNVQMGNAMAAEMGSCNPSTDVPMPCTGAVVEQGEVHTGTPTPTPSAPPIVPPATGPGATSTATPVPTLDPNATSTATPNADDPRDSRGVPRITPPATATPVSGSSSYVIAPTSQVAPVTVEPPAAADRGTTIGLPGAGDGGYLGHEDTSRAPWPWVAAGTVAAILAGLSSISKRCRRRTTGPGDGR